LKWEGKTRNQKREGRTSNQDKTFEMKGQKQKFEGKFSLFSSFFFGFLTCFVLFFVIENKKTTVHYWRTPNFLRDSNVSPKQKTTKE
jgi:hypothetical protein